MDAWAGKIASVDNHKVISATERKKRCAKRAIESRAGRERSKRENECEDRGDFVNTGLGDARPMIRLRGEYDLRSLDPARGRRKGGRTITYGEDRIGNARTAG